MKRGKPLSILFVCVALASGLASSLHGQQEIESGWNEPATVDLVRRSIERRSVEVVDTAMQNYQADARGYVYFLLDAPEMGRQSLVRTDQVALEVYWRAPNQIRQRIVGLRQQKELPVARLHYYLDRLAVVQDNYGQAIVIADGDNVRDVPHPVAAGALNFYDYQLADSLALRIPGVPDLVRVHEIRVRPRNNSVPAVVGSIFLEVSTGALVRMAFTFTPAAYVDPRLDYINVVLENGLWKGRFWLPHEQRLEIRRELPELDLPFGTIIRTHMQVNDYRFNEPIDNLLFLSRVPVTFAPTADRENFPFEQPIDAEWRAEGIGEPLAIDEIRRQARSVMRERAMSGLRRRRLAIPSASDVFRYNRAEGATLGGALGFRGVDVVGRVQGGWAFGPDHPILRLELRSADPTLFTGTGYLNRPLDVGGFQPASGATNTLGSLLFASDWTDPFFASGATGTARLTQSGSRSLTLGARVEQQRPAEISSTFSVFGSAGDFRPVIPVERGTLASLELVMRQETASTGTGFSGELRAAAGVLRKSDTSLQFGRLEADVARRFTHSARNTTADISLRGRFLVGDVPRQEIFLIGGRATLPGYDFRSFGGDEALLGNATFAADLARPWLRGRVIAAAGWSGIHTSGGREATALWGVPATGHVRGSAGVGFGLFYDLLRVDVVRGFSGGGETELIVEFQPDFWDFL